MTPFVALAQYSVHYLNLDGVPILPGMHGRVDKEYGMDVLEIL